MLITYIGGELDGQRLWDEMVPAAIDEKYQIVCFVTDDLKDGMEIKLANDSSISAAMDWLNNNVRKANWHLASQMPSCGDLTQLSLSHLDCIPGCRKVVTYYFDFDDAETPWSHLVVDDSGVTLMGKSYPNEEMWKAVLTFLNHHYFEPRIALALGKMLNLWNK